MKIPPWFFLRRADIFGENRFRGTNPRASACTAVHHDRRQCRLLCIKFNITEIPDARAIREVLYTTGITVTAGIGTNLYLAKLAMDITAKHAAPDKDGVRIAELDEESFQYLLWDHKPLTDFWQTGPGTVRRLEKHGIHTIRLTSAVSVQKFPLLRISSAKYNMSV